MPKMAANVSSPGARVSYWCHIPPSAGQPATRGMHGQLQPLRPHPPPLSPGQMHSLGRAQPTQTRSNTSLFHLYQPRLLKGSLSPSLLLSHKGLLQPLFMSLLPQKGPLSHCCAHLGLLSVWKYLCPLGVCVSRERFRGED